MNNGLVGSDVFLRMGLGHIQQFRAWDPKRFMEATIARGLEKDPPIMVQVCSQEQYRAEKWGKKNA